MRMRTLKGRFVAVAMLLVAAMGLNGCAIFHKKGATPVASNTGGHPPTMMATAPSTAPKPPAPKRPWYYYASPFVWIATVQRLIPHKAKPPAATPPQMVGVVKMVNKEDRFVLIDTASFQAASSGDSLVCITSQKQTAELRVSAMRNPPFLIADITSGLPSPGDKVYKP